MKPIIGMVGSPGELADTTIEAFNRKGFVVTSCRHADIVYVAPDRPQHQPDNFVQYALQEMRKDAILVIHCQVVPGFTRKINWPKERLYYQVETLRKGDALDRALNPERIIVGSFDNRIDAILYDFLEIFNCPIVQMTYESAELAKIAINLYLAAQVSVTNTLSEISEKIGAVWDDIIPALQTDKRIGKDAYLRPGYGLSTHLIRDLQTILNMEGNVDVMRSILNHSEYRRMLQDSLKPQNS